MKWYKKLWFWMVVLFLALSAFVWFFGPSVAINGVVPLMSDVVRAASIVGLFWLCSIIYLVIRLKYKSVKFSKEKCVEPESESESEESPTDAIDIHQTYNTLFFQARKMEAFYHTMSLPAFLVLGEKHAGKSTLLNHSQLDMPIPKIHAQQQDSPLRLWFTNSAVFIEQSTIGRDVEQWATALKEYHDFRKLNGILLCLDITSLPEPEIWRTQIDAIKEALNSDLPLYIVLTKCDRMIGFCEYYNSLPEKKSENIFGITANEYTDIPRELDVLINNISDNALKCSLDTEQQLDQKQVYAFPEQLKYFQKELHMFLKNCFSENYYQQEIKIKGLYFTAVAGKNDAMSFMENNHAGLFQFGKPLSYQQDHSPKSYFIKNLMSDIVSGKLGQALLPQKTVLKLQRKQRLTVVIATMVVVLVTAIWTNSYRTNSALLAQAQQDKNSINQVESSHQQDAASRLITLHQIASRYQSSNYTIVRSLGLSEMQRIHNYFASKYDAAAKITLVPLMKSLLESSIQQTNNNQLYQALKVYLMLGNSQYFNHLAVQNWLQNTNANVVTAYFKSHPNMQLLLTDYYQQFNQPMPLNQNLINNARRKLSEVSDAQRIYWQIQQAAAKKPFFSPSIISSQALYQVFGTNKLAINPFYMQQGLTKLFPTLRTEVVAESTHDNWVLGKPTVSSITMTASLKEQVNSLYANDYINQWHSALNDLNVTHFTSLTQLTTAVSTLAQPNSPINQVLQEVNENTDFAPKKTRSKKIKGFTFTIKPQASMQQNINQQFVQWHQFNTQSLQSTLQKLAKTLTAIINSHDPEQAAFNAAKNMNSAKSSIQAVLMLANSQPQPVQKWLKSLGNQAEQLILHSATNYVLTQWNQQIVVSYQNSLANLYPFNLKAKQEVQLGDLNKFFGPKGVLTQFMSHYIKPFVVNGNQQLFLPQSLLKQMQQANQINELLYGNNNAPKVSFTLKATDLSANVTRFSLKFAKQAIIDRHDPQHAVTFTWPASDDANNIELNFTNINGQTVNKNYQGPWAWYRLLTNNRLKADVNGQYDLTIGDQIDAATLHVGFNRTPNLLTHGLTLNLHSVTNRN